MVSEPFAQLVGQQQAIELLGRAIANHRIAPAYLFMGPHGVGRSLAAQQFLQQLLTVSSRATASPASLENHPDLLWIEPTYTQAGKLITASAMAAKGDKPPKAQPQVRLAQIRDINRFLSQSPLEATRQLVVIDQAETMKEAAANGLLKTLEEPGNATIILLAPKAASLLPTLVSRCHSIPFRCLTPAQMQQVLMRTEYSEILAHPAILAMAQGSPGAAILAWQQLQEMPKELLERCQQLPKTAQDCLRLAQAIEQTLEQTAQVWLIGYLQQLYWQSYGQAHLLQTLETARRYLLQYAQPRLVWEVALLALMEGEVL